MATESCHTRKDIYGMLSEKSSSMLNPTNSQNVLAYFVIIEEYIPVLGHILEWVDSVHHS
jgi:hypothetical protein